MALRRSDNKHGVILDLDMTIVPSAYEMQTLLPRIMAEQADEDELALFAVPWQARVKQMLIRYADDPALIRTSEWKEAA